MKIEVVKADYLNAQHARDLCFLLNCYAEDPMGGGKPLSDYVQENLPKQLSEISNAFSIICYVDEQPAGLANCFELFSTFKCKPLINIHDLVVNQQFRGLGISQRLLEKIESIAREKSCCKITLEVLDGNVIAKNAYRKFGFSDYELDPKMGRALFWEKPLGPHTNHKPAH